jgi:chromosome segregation ATPase
MTAGTFSGTPASQVGTCRIMKDPTQSAAIRLAELSREVIELESASTSLLNRLDQIRNQVHGSAQRITAVSASVDLLCEHIAEVSSALEELTQLEREVRDLAEGIDENDRDSKQMLFESESLNGSLEEAEEELERLSALLEGKAKRPRGH